MLTVVSGRIIVVDDDPDWSYIIKRILTRFGNEVVTVASGPVALEAMEKEAYDIIIIDVRLPGTSGIDLIPRIRTLYSQTAIYVISEDPASYSAARALELGAERCIDKSIEPDALQKMVESTIERQRLMRSLRAERRRYERLVSNAAVGVFTLDIPTEQFTYVNRYLLDLMGFSMNEIIGHHPVELVAPADKERLLTRLHARIEREALPAGDKTTYRFINKNGAQIDLQVETHVVNAEDEPFIEGTARDVTVENRLSRLQEIVTGLGRSILSSHDIDHILQSVLNAITQYSGFQRAVVSLYDLSAPVPQESAVHKMLASGLNEDEVRTLSATSAMSPEERKLAFDEKFRLEDAYYIPHDRAPWRPNLGLKGSVKIDGWDPDDFLFIPLRGSTGIIGHISIDDPVDRSVPTGKTLKPVVALTNLAALAVERTYRYKQLVEQKKRLHGLAKFSQELAQAQDIQQMCAIAAKRMWRDMHYEFFGIWIREEDELVLSGFVSQGEYAHEDTLYPGLRMPISGNGFARWVLENQREIVVPDVRTESNYLKWSDLTRSEIDVPILARKEALGVLSVEASRVDAFGAQDKEIIGALASQLSVAITNLRGRTFLSQIRDLAHMLLGATTIEELVNSTLEFISEQFSMQRSVVLLREGEELVVRELHNSKGLDSMTTTDRSVADKGIVGWVMEHRMYALVNDVTKDSRHVTGIDKTRSEMAVPVMIGDTIFGVLDIKSQQTGFFDDEDRRLLSAAAAQFAVALSNLDAQSKLREQAVRDPLTQLFNRHYLNEVIEGELDRADRYGHEITLMMLDINGFRRVNNTLGHLKGDEVLQKVSQALKESVRTADRVIRYGGDEFLIFMPETVNDAGIIEKRLKKNVDALAERLGLGNLNIGLSIGTYTRHPGDTLAIEEILARADQLMYDDKRRTYSSQQQIDDYHY